jgi:hypothetical protein
MQANWSGGGSMAAKGALMGTSILPGWGTAIGAGAGFVAGMFMKKKDPELIEDYNKTASSGGYFTVPRTGVPGHPEWKPGSRQWIPPGSPSMDAEGKIGGISDTGEGGGGIGGSGINYDAIRERAIAPTRAMYQNTMRQLQRQPGMGVNNPGYGAQMTALSRGMSSSLSDAATNAEAQVSNTRLQEIGQQNQYALGQRGLDVEEKKLPSATDKKIATTNKVLDLIGTGADIYKGMGSPGLG